MKGISDMQGMTLLWPRVYTPPPRAPLYAAPGAAVFPSPAHDCVEKEVNLKELCIRRRTSTFFAHASGSSMQEPALCDIAVIEDDYAEDTSQGDFVIAEANGEFAANRLQLQPRLALLPVNPTYCIIYPEELKLLGIVTCLFNSTRSHRR